MFVLVLTCIAAVAALVLLRHHYVLWRHYRSSLCMPPLVTSMIPFLGCSLAYKRDPRKFLLQCVKKFGPVFTLDLAGWHITVLASADALR